MTKSLNPVTFPKVKPHETGIKAARELIEDIKGSPDSVVVDQYLQDQLIIYMALAEGTSTLKVKTWTCCLHVVYEAVIILKLRHVFHLSTTWFSKLSFYGSLSTWALDARGFWTATSVINACRLKVGPLTLHTKTAIEIAGLLTGADFKVTKTSNDGAASGMHEQIILESMVEKDIPTHPVNYSIRYWVLTFSEFSPLTGF